MTPSSVEVGDPGNRQAKAGRPWLSLRGSAAEESDLSGVAHTAPTTWPLLCWRRRVYSVQTQRSGHVCVIRKNAAGYLIPSSEGEGGSSRGPGEARVHAHARIDRIVREAIMGITVIGPTLRSLF